MGESVLGGGGGLEDFFELVMFSWDLNKEKESFIKVYG